MSTHMTNLFLSPPPFVFNGFNFIINRSCIPFVFSEMIAHDKWCRAHSQSMDHHHDQTTLKIHKYTRTPIHNEQWKVRTFRFSPGKLRTVEKVDYCWRAKNCPRNRYPRAVVKLWTLELNLQMFVHTWQSMVNEEFFFNRDIHNNNFMSPFYPSFF